MRKAIKNTAVRNHLNLILRMPGRYLLIVLLLVGLFQLNPLFGQISGYQWVKTLTDSTNGDSSGSVSSSTIAIDEVTGAVYTGGGFGGKVDFYPGPGENIMISVGINDMFLSKLDTNGNFIWAIPFTGDPVGGLSKILVEPSSGNIYMVGWFQGTIDMDPGSNYFPLISIGSDDILVAKVSSAGNLIWAKSLGGIDAEYARSMTLDENGNVYVTGDFRGTCDFNPGNGVYNLTSNGDVDMFVFKLDSGGNFIWAEQVGGTAADRAIDVDIDLTDGDDIVITGIFSAACDFDPGPGTFILNANFNYNIFILKLDSAGAFKWAKAIGGPYQGDIRGITIDQSNGSIYITGYFSWTVDFDPGPGVFNITSFGIWDIYILKLNTDGNFVWAVGTGGVYAESTLDIAVDEIGNIYATGFFTYTCDFDPGAGVFALTALDNEDVFVLKLSSAGTFIWAKAFNGVRRDDGSAIAVDQTGFQNVFTTGFTEGITDFDPGPAVFNLGNSNMELTQFVSRLDNVGDFIWAKTFGDEEIIFGEVKSSSIDTDSLNGSVCISGTFSGKVDFDPGADTVNLVSINYYDGFVSLFNTDGQLAWVKSFGAPDGNVWTCVMTRAGDGDIYIAGSFVGFVDFDPGPGTHYLNSEENFAAFICKLDSNGNFIWAKPCKGPGNIIVASICLDNAENIYLTGNFNLSIDFDPDAGVFNLLSNGGEDIFISKLDSSGNFLWAKSMGGILTWENDIIEGGNSIVVDPVDGCVYTTGAFDYTPVDFDPGPGTFIIEMGTSVNTFILKLDTEGYFKWAKAFSGENWIVGNSIDINSDNQQVLTTGYFSHRVDFDPGPGVYNLFPVGYTDAFISALDTAGNFVFAKAVGGPGFDTGNSIVANNWGSENIYVTGSFQQTVDFDPGSGTSNFISEGDADIFLLNLDGSGNFSWATTAGGSLPEYGVALARGNSADVLWTGYFYSDSVGFDSIFLTNTIPYTCNTFIAKIGQCSTVVTSAADGGNGSLRDVISCAANGATITFALPPLTQITLTAGEIQINKSLTLSGTGVINLVISGNNNNRIMHLLPGNNLTIKNMSLKNTTAATNGGAIYAQGNLFLENVLLENNFQNGIPKSLTLENGVQLNIKGSVDFKY